MIARLLSAALLIALITSSILGVAGGAPAIHATASPPMVAPTHSTASSRSLMPHPFDVRAAKRGVSPNSYSGHYWDGAYYTGPAFNSTKIAVNLSVPDGVPYVNEFYYVIDSVWDNAGSYDQIGISNDGGTWGFAYSYTSPCAGNYYYSPDYFSLVRGTTYAFSMTLSSGNLTFNVSDSKGHVGGLRVHTGGTAFFDQAFYSCSSGTYYDYTDYEEVYNTVQSLPSFSFLFTNNTANAVTVSGWSTFATAPANATLGFSGGNVSIENQAFWMSFSRGPDSKVLKAGTIAYKTQIDIHALYGTSNVSLSYSGSRTAFSVTFSPKIGGPGFLTNVVITVLTTSKTTVYQLYFDGTGVGGSYTYVELLLRVK
jgi:hypothetical protein